jgi:hypothetical protein
MHKPDSLNPSKTLRMSVLWTRKQLSRPKLRDGDAFARRL